MLSCCSNAYVQLLRLAWLISAEQLTIAALSHYRNWTFHSNSLGEKIAMTETNVRAESAKQRLRELIEKQDHAESGSRRLAQALTGLLDSRLTCKVCEEALAAYVDDEISGVDVARKYPDVKRHLDLCQDCASIYIRMLQLAWEVEQRLQSLPVPESALDLSFLPRPTFQDRAREYVSALAEELTAILAPQEMDVLKIIRDTFFARIAAFGEQFTLREGAQVAMGFDSEATEGLRILATTYIATLEVAMATPMITQEQIEDAQWAHELRRRVENLARDMGMGHQWARTFAQRYVELITSKPEMVIELAATKDRQQ